MSVNDNIRKYRINRSLSLQQFAAQTGISLSDCQKIENGTKPLSSAEVQRICKVLGVDIDTLMTASVPDPEEEVVTEGSVLMPFEELQNLLGKMKE